MPGALVQALQAHVGDFTMAAKLQRSDVRSRIALFLLVILSTFSPLAFSQTQPTPSSVEPLSVGFVYVSPIFEAGWTQQHDQGRRALEAALGNKLKTRFVADVSEGSDAERVIRDLAMTGSRLIITTSFGYMEPTLKVAAQFPQVKFIHVSGYKQSPNVATVNARYYEGRYLAGIVAGKSTKTNTLGYVAAFPIPEVLQGINAFTLGARSVNPAVQVRVIWTQTWTDPAKEREAAKTLIGQGADVLTHHTATTAVAQTAEEQGVRFIAYTSDMSKFAPKAQLLAVTHHWGDYYIQAARQILAGTWQSTNTWGGLKTGMVKLSAWNADVNRSLVAQVDLISQQMMAGTLHPFTGPIKDNNGKLQWEKSAMPDPIIEKMNYLVEGIVGRLQQ
mgnify:CR=1 FL=1